MSTVWRYSRQVGSGPTVTFIGSGPLAILAGFSLSAALAVAQRRHSNSVLHNVSIASFGLSVAALVLTLMLVISSQMYWASPDQRLAWRPEALVSLEALEEERREQSEDYHLLVKYYKNINLSFEVGLVATLAGLATALLAEHIGWGSGMATGFMAVVAILVVMWHFEMPKSLFPSPQQVQAKTSPLDDVGIASIIGGPAGIETPGSPVEWLLKRAAELDLEDLLSECLDVVARKCDGFHTTATSIVGDRLVDGKARLVVELNVYASDAGGIRCSLSVPELARHRHETVDLVLTRLSKLAPRDGVGGLGYLCRIHRREELEAILD